MTLKDNGKLYNDEKKKKAECKIKCWLGCPAFEKNCLHLSKNRKRLTRIHKSDKCTVMIGLCIYFQIKF